MIGLALLALATVGPVAEASGSRQVIVMGWDAQARSCSAQVNGVAVGDPTSDDALPVLLRALPDRAKPVELHGTQSVPYRCVGGLVTALQHEGYRFKVGL